MEATIEKSGYYPPLTGVRVLAAYMVFFHHFNPFGWLGKDTVLYQFCTEMHVGVTLFFFLSGFLIAHRYFHASINWKNYFINRFARIYPVYFLLTAITFLFLFLKANGFDVMVFLLNISFLRGFFDSYKFTGIAQGWSLTVEETFYFMAPILFFIFRKHKLTFFLMPLFLISIGIFIYQPKLEFMLDFTFFGRSVEFISGIVLAVYLPRIPKIKTINFTYLGLISILFWIYLLSQIKGVHGYGTDTMIGKVINTVCLPILGFVPFFIGILKEKTSFSKLLNTSLFQLLGKSSYVFYLIHLGIFHTILSKISSNYVFLFIGLNLLSVVLYLFFEKPMNALIRSKFSQ